MHFIGEYSHQLDAKNRIRIPAKLKKEFGEQGYYFAKGTDRCIFVYPESVIHEKIDKLNSEIKVSDKEKQASLRKFHAQLFVGEEDTQGRVVLSAKLREYAQIDKNIIVLGVGNRIEIWAEEVYNQYMVDADEDMQAVYSILDL